MPPSTATPSRRAAPLPPGERRATIVSAMMPLLLDRGTAVTTREIAAAAGVSEGTIFKVFADKDELIAAAVERALDLEPFERAIGAIDATLPFEPRLVEATGVIQRRVVDVWRLVSRLGPEYHTPRSLPDSPAVIALFEANAATIRIEPRQAARLLRALTLSLTHPLFVAEPYEASEIVELFLRGSGVPS